MLGRRELKIDSAVRRFAPMKQAHAFLDGEAYAWLERNREKMGRCDRVSATIEALALRPSSILEIGCADGWRIERLKSRFSGCRVRGIDPLPGNPPSRWTIRGAENLGAFQSAEFDLVIFGFCLYRCDRDHLFTIAAEADRVLRDDGYLISHDFAPPEQPFASRYEHRTGIFSYHMDYGKLWLAHPWYRQITVPSFDEDESVVVLRKGCAAAFPMRI
jgi:SAM-dependent methyltransferase